MPNMQKTDLQSIVKNNCKYLSADHQKKLLQRLFKFESLSDGTLGDWKSKPVSLFQLKEGASPYHGRAFPIHKDVLIKEVERLCKLGVLERQHYFEWASPSFTVPKKITPCFLSDFWEVKKRSIRPPFQSPK